MAIIKIKPSEQVLLNAIATDNTACNADGIQVQPTTPYATAAYPFEDYAGLVEKHPEIIQEIQDGTKGYFAALIRRMGPITAQASGTPTLAFSGLTQLITYTFPEVFEVPRTVEVLVNGTSFCTVAVGTRMDFYVDVNGVPGTSFKSYFSELSSPKSFVGSWIVTLPAGTPIVKIYGTRALGGGTINFDGNTFVNMTIKG